MTFNTDQAGMAIFLFFAALMNAWFVFTSFKRIKKNAGSENVTSSSLPNGLGDDTDQVSQKRSQLLNYSVLSMALFDIPWVWLCMIQCWNNMLTDTNALHQTNGDDSLGCRLMGWYSTFSLVAMMGSHNVVAYYLKNYLLKNNVGFGSSSASPLPFLETKKGFLSLALSLLVVASIFASMPLMGSGYYLTNGGFCYADFSDKIQSSVMLSFILVLLGLATATWFRIGQWSTYWLYYAVFFITWTLWIPAASYGIATGEEIPSPYFIIGAVVGHSNAFINPLLYGLRLYRILRRDHSENAQSKGTSDSYYGSLP